MIASLQLGIVGSRREEGSQESWWFWTEKRRKKRRIKKRIISDKMWMIYYINMYQSKDVYFLYIIHKNIYFSIVSYDKK